MCVWWASNKSHLVWITCPSKINKIWISFRFISIHVDICVRSVLCCVWPTEYFFFLHFIILILLIKYLSRSHCFFFFFLVRIWRTQYMKSSWTNIHGRSVCVCSVCVCVCLYDYDHCLCWLIHTSARGSTLSGSHCACAIQKMEIIHKNDKK